MTLKQDSQPEQERFTPLDYTFPSSLPECLQIFGVQYCQTDKLQARKDVESGMFVIGFVVWIVLMGFFIGRDRSKKAAVVFVSGPLLFGLYFLIRGLFGL